MKEIVIYPSTGKLKNLAWGSLTLLAVSVVLLIAPSTAFPLKAAVGYLGIGFFGLCLLFAIHRLVKRVPSVVISQDGIFDNASAAGAGFLRWSEVADIRVVSVLDQRFIAITPVDQRAVLARLNPLKRMLIQMNKGLSGAPFNIPATTLPVSFEALLSDIESYRALAPNG